MEREQGGGIAGGLILVLNLDSCAWSFRGGSESLSRMI